METVTSSGTATVTLPTDEQILITREFDAPKHLVYKAWTTPELVKRWWSGGHGEVTIAEIDLRVGGEVALRDDRERGVRGRLPRRVPRDRPGRADRLDRGLRGHAGRGGAGHADAHRSGRAHHPDHPRRALLQGAPRRPHQLRDGGRHAGSRWTCWSRWRSRSASWRPCRPCARRPPSAPDCRRCRGRCSCGSGCCRRRCRSCFPPLLEASGVFAMAAARDLLMPFLRRPSYCLSSLMLGP